jgi:hypothetical protein
MPKRAFQRGPPVDLAADWGLRRVGMGETRVNLSNLQNLYMQEIREIIEIGGVWRQSRY